MHPTGRPLAWLNVQSLSAITVPAEVVYQAAHNSQPHDSQPCCRSWIQAKCGARTWKLGDCIVVGTQQWKSLPVERAVSRVELYASEWSMMSQLGVSRGINSTPWRSPHLRFCTLCALLRCSGPT